MCFALRKTLRRGCLGRPVDLLPDAQLPALAPHDSHRHRRRSYLPPLLASAGLRGLARLLADLLALVADTLAAVGLRRPEAADLGGRLAHRSLSEPVRITIVPFESPGISHLTPCGQREGDGVREAEGEVAAPGP